MTGIIYGHTEHLAKCLECRKEYDHKLFESKQRNGNRVSMEGLCWGCYQQVKHDLSRLKEKCDADKKKLVAQNKLKHMSAGVRIRKKKVKVD